MNKKLNIAIIGSRGYPYVYSGYETLVKELSERMISRGHNVRVYCHNSLFKSKPKNVNGIELIYTPSIETKFLSQFVNSLFSFIHVSFSKIDIVFVVNSANGPFGILTKIFRKKTLINVDGLEWLRPKWKGLGGIYYKIASKLSTILFDYVITDSYEMKKIYQDKFNSSSFVIAYGPTVFRNENHELIESEFNLKKNNYYLIVGRLIPDNNVKLIVDGFLKSCSNKKIVVVGDVPYKDKYADSLKKINDERLILTGYVKDPELLSQLYNNCYSYVHGHEFGGTNPTMINALNINCKIIALKTNFNIEMLNNKEAIYFNKDINSVVNSFNKFEKSTSNFNNKYLLPKIYDWNYITESYIKLFKQI